MDNKFTGVVPLEFGGKEYKIVFDWEALALLKSEFSQEEQSKLFTQQNPHVLAKVLVFGLKRHHPEVTAEQILKASPPFLKVVSALDRALRWAYFGIDEADDTDDVKKSGKDKGTKKKKK